MLITHTDDVSTSSVCQRPKYFVIFLAQSYKKARYKSMIIDHINVYVSDYDRSKIFYQKVLLCLNIELILEFKKKEFSFAGFGKASKPEFWIGTKEKPSSPIHIAFQASDRESVKHFYESAIEAGAKDNGIPGTRTIYHPNYYGAFVLDPDGHNIEAVCHQ